MTMIDNAYRLRVITALCNKATELNLEALELHQRANRLEEQAKALYPKPELPAPEVVVGNFADTIMSKGKELP